MIKSWIVFNFGGDHQLTAGFFPTLTANTAYTIGYNGAKVIATGVVMFWNFFINRLWTYNDVK